MKKSEKTGLSAYRAVLAPYSIWSLLFVIVPLAFVAYYAFTDNNFQFTTEHITRFFTATSSLVQDLSLIHICNGILKKESKTE